MNERHRANVFVYPLPNGQEGYYYFATDANPNTVPVEGKFNNTTINDNPIRSGSYDLTPRPYIPKKTGLSGLKRWLGLALSGNIGGDPNRNFGRAVLSNTGDGNTIVYPDGTVRTDITIHPGANFRGEGGNSLGCLVPNNRDFESLNEMLQKNYRGKARLHLYDTPYGEYHERQK
ncbi:MAG: hypothetical protein ACPGOY_18510 [Rhodospirillaceae bacterium]